MRLVWNRERLDVEGLSLLFIQVVEYVEFPHADSEAPGVRAWSAINDAPMAASAAVGWRQRLWECGTSSTTHQVLCSGSAAAWHRQG